MSYSVIFFLASSIRICLVVQLSVKPYARYVKYTRLWFFARKPRGYALLAVTGRIIVQFLVSLARLLSCILRSNILETPKGVRDSDVYEDEGGRSYPT